MPKSPLSRRIRVSLPPSVGGLMRFEEMYKSYFVIKPEWILIIATLICIFLIVLNLVFMKTGLIY